MNKSFTLIEILVVIVVIGILSAFILVGMSSITNSANFAKGKAFFNSMDNSLLLSRVSQWKFDGPNNSGNATIDELKDSWTNNNGTVVAGNEPNIMSSGCPSVNCLSFNGSSDYVDYGSNSNLSPEVGTIALWFKANTHLNNQELVTKHSDTAYVKVQFNGNNLLQLYVRDAVGYDNTPKITITDESWHYVVFVLGNEGARGYFDGIKKYDDSSLLRGLDITSANLWMGARNGAVAGTFFNGYLDDVRIYSGAMPVSRVEEDYYSGVNNLIISNGINRVEYIDRLAELKNHSAKQ